MKKIIGFGFLGIIGASLVLGYCHDSSTVEQRYSFTSSVNQKGNEFVTTEAIVLPKAFWQKNEYMINNATGYDVCIFTQENGCQTIGQGETVIDGTPTTFFVVKPEDSNDKYKEGQLSISSENGEKEIIDIRGNNEEIAKVVVEVK